MSINYDRKEMMPNPREQESRNAGKYLGSTNRSVRRTFPANKRVVARNVRSRGNARPE
jgi:hypothetical protein